jgi:hypothetical protein
MVSLKLRPDYVEKLLKITKGKYLSQKEFEKALKEGCKEMAEDSLKMCKDWRAAEPEWPEWKAAKNRRGLT